MPGHVNGFTLAYAGVGAVVMWSGIKGETISATFRGLLSGQAPNSNQEPISGSAAAAPQSGYSIATNIPASKGSYSQSQLEKLWTDNGGPADTAAFAAAVAEAESGGDATVTSSNPDGGTNVGLWQLDTKGVGSGYPVADLQDANLNCQITIMATNGGVNWQEWGDPVTAAVGYRYTPGTPVP